MSLANVPMVFTWPSEPGSAFTLRLCKSAVLPLHFALCAAFLDQVVRKEWKRTYRKNPVSRERNRRDWPAEVNSQTHIDFHTSGFNLKSNHSAHDTEVLSSNETIRGSSKPQSQQQKGRLF